VGHGCITITATRPIDKYRAPFWLSGTHTCDPATLSDDFTIHITDLLMPDGVTRMWLDLKYSKALSTNGSAYFVGVNGD